jgi:hypothetical protein
MAYSESSIFNNDIFPKRTDPIYGEIEDFQPYELTHCVVYEMAVRNTEIKIKLDKCNQITKIKQQLEKRLMHKYFGKHIYLDRANIVSSKINHYTKLNDNLINELIYKHLIFPDNFELKDTGLENSLLIEKILEKPSVHYPISQTIYDGLKISQGIYEDDSSFDINKIQNNFKRKINDANQVYVSLNTSLSENELVAYIQLIKKNAKYIKTPSQLLGKETESAELTKNFPKKPAAAKLADMFFVYDYVTEKLKEHTYCIKLMEDEYNENKNEIKNSTLYTTKDKKIQLQALLEEHEENTITVKVEDIFKKFDNPIENINFKSSTASNYYYALKPYIEECRYPEFLTGESVIEAKETEN